MKKSNYKSLVKSSYKNKPRSGKSVRFIIFALLLILLGNCALVEKSLVTFPTPTLLPDYNTSDDSFISADTNILGSEFIDQYVNQYVVFDGYYLTHRQGAFLPNKLGQPVIYKDIMEADIYPPEGPVNPRKVQVIWSIFDRDL